MTASEATGYCNNKKQKGVCSSFPGRCDKTCAGCAKALESTNVIIEDTIQVWVVTWRIAYVESLLRRRLASSFMDIQVEEQIRKAVVDAIPLLSSWSRVKVAVSRGHITITVSFDSGDNPSAFYALLVIMDSLEFEMFVAHVSHIIDTAVVHVLTAREEHGSDSPTWLYRAVEAVSKNAPFTKVVVDTKADLARLAVEYDENEHFSPTVPPVMPPNIPPQYPTRLPAFPPHNYNSYDSQ
jgi:hypothetical protein